MRRNHDDDPLQGGDDFLPSDFEAEVEGLGIRSPADFVQRTLARVLAERGSPWGSAGAGDSGPLAAAGGGEQPALPPEFLAAFTVPDPSPHFVERTLARITSGEGEPISDLELDRLMARHQPPRVSADFVARTLAALRETEPQPEPVPPEHGLQGHGLRLLPTAAPRRRLALVAAAAVLVIGLGAILLRGALGSTPVPRARALVASTFEFSPSPTTVVFARQNAAPIPSQPDDDLDFRPLDGLTLLAAGVARSSE